MSEKEKPPAETESLGEPYTERFFDAPNGQKFRIRIPLTWELIDDAPRQIRNQNISDLFEKSRVRFIRENGPE